MLAVGYTLDQVVVFILDPAEVHTLGREEDCTPDQVGECIRALEEAYTLDQGGECTLVLVVVYIQGQEVGYMLDQVGGCIQDQVGAYTLGLAHPIQALFHLGIFLCKNWRDRDYHQLPA